MTAILGQSLLVWNDSFGLNPTWLLVGIAIGFGVIIGSFLNVYIYRFHTGKSLSGSSHCLSCGHSLRWHDLFPVVSYVWLQGRCRDCGCRIPVRYALVEVGTAGLFAAAALLATSWFSVLWWWLVMSVLMVIFVYDLYHFIIPDGLTLTLTGLVLGQLLGEGAVGNLGLPQIGATLVAAVLGASFFLFLWFVSRGRWLGFGDVKLAVPLGLLVGPSLVFSFVVYSFWVGAAVSLGLMLWQHIKRGQSRLRKLPQGLTIKSAVPFAPFLIIAALIVVFTQSNVLSLFTF